MTEAQWKVRLEQISAESKWDDRDFRKKCVTQKIVTFSRDKDSRYYTVRYRYLYVASLFGDYTDKYKLMTMWNVVRIAEETIEKIEGVKHESN